MSSSTNSSSSAPSLSLVAAATAFGAVIGAAFATWKLTRNRTADSHFQSNATSLSHIHAFPSSSASVTPLPQVSDSHRTLKVTELSEAYRVTPADACSVHSTAVSLPSHVSIRRATHEDRDHLYNLMRLVTQKRGGLARETDEVSSSYIDGMLGALDGGLMLVAIDTSQAASSIATPSSPFPLIGVLKASPIGPHRCFRHVLSDCTIAVHPNCQNRKIGQALLQTLLSTLSTPSSKGGEFAHVLRLELIARESNSSALQMYEKMGFRFQSLLHSRIVSGMPLECDENAASSMKLRFESDVQMVWFNPRFELPALHKQYVNSK